jgi:hypothetical protein
MKRVLTPLPLVLTALITVAACDSRPEAQTAMTFASAPAQAPPAEYALSRMKAADQSAQGGAADAPKPSATAAPAPNAASREETSRSNPLSALKLIRRANVQIEVPKFKTAVEEIARSVEQLGGYVSDRTSTDGGDGREQGTLTLRVPAERFDGAMGVLRKLGRVSHENISTDDVTKAYADLETRLKVKRETATRLREILVRQAGKVSEVLEVEREIARVVEEIEQAEGERRYFDHQISLSTIVLNLYEPNAVVEPGALEPLFRALRGALRVSSESLALLIGLCAAALPWAIVLYVVFRVLRARWRRRT